MSRPSVRSPLCILGQSLGRRTKERECVMLWGTRVSKDKGLPAIKWHIGSLYSDRGSGFG